MANIADHWKNPIWESEDDDDDKGGDDDDEDHEDRPDRQSDSHTLLVNLPACSLQKLQRVLNTAARTVSLRPKCDIIPVLISLHWLPIEHRIHYKVILFVLRCLHGLASSYLSELLKLYAPERENLRYSESLWTTACHQPNNYYGERAFSVSGSVLWNSLPDDIRLLDDRSSFKSKLKTWLFNDVYKEHL